MTISELEDKITHLCDVVAIERDRVKLTEAEVTALKAQLATAGVVERELRELHRRIERESHPQDGMTYRRIHAWASHGEQIDPSIAAEYAAALVKVARYGTEVRKYLPVGNHPEHRETSQREFKKALNELSVIEARMTGGGK